jgi:beta-lactamase class A
MLTSFLFLALAAAPELTPLTAVAHGTVGVAALHLETGHGFGAHEGERFPMQSVFKLPVAIEVLARVDAGKLRLGDPIAMVEADRRPGAGDTLGGRIPGPVSLGDLLDAMLVASDNAACDKLLALVGGPAAVTARMHALGLDAIVVDRTEAELARGQAGDTATPASLAALLGKVARGELGLSAESQTLLRATLGRVETGAHRLKAGLPPGATLEHKTGSSRTLHGVTEATNDVGVITLKDGTHLVLVVLVRDARADEATREGVIAGVAREAVAWAERDR